GSRNLRHIDAALVGYTFACLFAAFGLGYRYSMWLQRPPTRRYWWRGWQSFLRKGRFWGSLKHFVVRFVGMFLLNLFIWRRSPSRGLTHVLIMWGCILAAAITFPFVFGWVHFRTVPGDLTRYTVFVFGFPTFSFPHASLIGVPGDRRRAAGFPPAAARPRRRRTPGLSGRPAAAVPPVRDQRHGPAADGQLHLAQGLRLRVPGHHARGHGHLHPPVAAVRQVLPHLPAAGPARDQVLHRRRQGGRAGDLRSLPDALRNEDPRR